MANTSTDAPCSVYAYRDQGILILAGGLTVHSFEDLSSFNEKTAKPVRHCLDCFLAKRIFQTCALWREAGCSS